MYKWGWVNVGSIRKSEEKYNIGGKEQHLYYIKPVEDPDRQMREYTMQEDGDIFSYHGELIGDAQNYIERTNDA